MDIPFIDSQDPNLLQYAELDPDAWLEASSKASDAPPPASEREREASSSQPPAVARRMRATQKERKIGPKLGPAEKLTSQLGWGIRIKLLTF